MYLLFVLACEPTPKESPSDSVLDTDTAAPDDSSPTVTDADGDGIPAEEDCDDTNAQLGGDEVPYDGLDNDCDAGTPDDDLDGDGVGLAEDCDDTNPQISPQQAEVPYNQVDEDCNPGTLDDDLDQDGYPLAQDCDDQNPEISPAMAEIPYNGVDEDCSPATPDDDLDGDGYAYAEDCNDADGAQWDNSGFDRLVGVGGFTQIAYNQRLQRIDAFHAQTSSGGLYFSSNSVP